MGRRHQLINFLRDEDVDIVGLQERIRQDFSISELERLSRHKFSWHWLSVMGHSGGILLGAMEDTFEIEDMDHGEFFVSMSLTHRQSNLRWEVIIVYGPMDHRRSAEFLAELRDKVERCPTLVVVAGDFNLILSLMTRAQSMWTSLGCACSTNRLRTWLYGRSLGLECSTPGPTTRLS